MGPLSFLKSNCVTGVKSNCILSEQLVSSPSPGGCRIFGTLVDFEMLGWAHPNGHICLLNAVVNKLIVGEFLNICLDVLGGADELWVRTYVDYPVPHLRMNLEMGKGMVSLEAWFQGDRGGMGG